MAENNEYSGMLEIKDRKWLMLDKVKNVVGFDESYVSMDTEAGRLTVEGAELKIESLTKEDGRIHISGRIDGVYYSGERVAKGVFSRIFK